MATPLDGVDVVLADLDGVVEEIVTAEIDSWPIGREFPIHARMQAITLEVILRAVFGVAEGPRLDRLRGMLANLLAAPAEIAIRTF